MSGENFKQLLEERERARQGKRTGSVNRSLQLVALSCVTGFVATLLDSPMLVLIAIACLGAASYLFYLGKSSVSASKVTSSTIAAPPRSAPSLKQAENNNQHHYHHHDLSATNGKESHLSKLSTEQIGAQLRRREEERRRQIHPSASSGGGAGGGGGSSAFRSSYDAYDGSNSFLDTHSGSMTHHHQHYRASSARGGLTTSSGIATHGDLNHLIATTLAREQAHQHQLQHNNGGYSASGPGAGAAAMPFPTAQSYGMGVASAHNSPQNYRGSPTSNHPSMYGNQHHPMQQNQMHLHFADNKRSGGAVGESQMNDETEWAQLGVRDLAASTLRVRAWVAKNLHAILVDIRRCNKYFGEKGLSTFDCTHNLEELHELPASAAPAAPPAPSFGSFAPPAAAKPAQPQQLRKLDCLLNERNRLVAAGSQSIDQAHVMSMIDLRLQLEALLDVENTFPTNSMRGTSSGLTAADKTRRQTYIVRRLEALASNPAMPAYQPNGGDPEVFLEDYPSDPHLVMHAIRYHVRPLARHVRLAHEPMTEHKDLALLIGNVGEPYFYVRYRNPPTDRKYHTTQGKDSLFQALLILAAVVQRNHDGSYGGVFGVLDLEDVKLSKVCQ